MTNETQNKMQTYIDEAYRKSHAVKEKGKSLAYPLFLTGNFSKMMVYYSQGFIN